MKMYDDVVLLHKDWALLQDGNNSPAFWNRFDLSNQKFCIFDGEKYQQLEEFDNKNKLLDPTSKEIKDMTTKDRKKLQVHI